MDLAQEEHSALRNHYGDAYLIQSLHSLAVHRDNSPVCGLIGADVFRKAWEKISFTLRSLYETVVEGIKRLGWRIIVEIGNVPEMFERLATALGKAMSVTGRRLVSVMNTISSSAGALWEYIRHLFSAAGTKEYAAVSQAESESVFDFSRIWKEFGTIFGSVARQIASNMLTVIRALRDIMYDATKAMAGVFYNLCETAVDLGSSMAEEIRMGVATIWMGISDMRARADFTNALVRRVSKIVRRILDSISSSSSSLVSLADGWLWKSWEAIRLPVEWVLRYAYWLVATLVRVSGISFVLVTTFPLLSTLFDKLFGKPVDDAIVQTTNDSKFAPPLHQLLQTVDQISKKTQLPRKVRNFAKSSIGFARQFVKTIETEPPANTSDKILLQDTLVSARALTNLSQGFDPDIDELDDLCRRRMGGLGITDFFQGLNDVVTALDVAIVKGIAADRGQREAALNPFLGAKIEKVKGKKKKRKKRQDPSTTQELEQYRQRLENEFGRARNILQQAIADYDLGKEEIFWQAIDAYRTQRDELLEQEEEQMMGGDDIKTSVRNIGDPILRHMIEVDENLVRAIDEYARITSELERISKIQSQRKGRMRNIYTLLHPLLLVLVLILMGATGYISYRQLVPDGFDVVYQQWLAEEAAKKVVKPDILDTSGVGKIQKFMKSFWFNAATAVDTARRSDVGVFMGLALPSFKKLFDPRSYIERFQNYPPAIAVAFTVPYASMIYYLGKYVKTIAGFVFFFTGCAAWATVEGVMDNRIQDSWNEQMALIRDRGKKDVAEIIVTTVGMIGSWVGTTQQTGQDILAIGSSFALGPLPGVLSLLKTGKGRISSTLGMIETAAESFEKDTGRKPSPAEIPQAMTQISIDEYNQLLRLKSSMLAQLQQRTHRAVLMRDEGEKGKEEEEEEEDEGIPLLEY